MNEESGNLKLQKYTPRKLREVIHEEIKNSWQSLESQVTPRCSLQDRDVDGVEAGDKQGPPAGPGRTWRLVKSCASFPVMTHSS